MMSSFFRNGNCVIIEYENYEVRHFLLKLSSRTRNVEISCMRVRSQQWFDVVIRWIGQLLPTSIQLSHGRHGIIRNK